MQEILRGIQQSLAESFDLKIRKLRLSQGEARLFYISDISDRSAISRDILRPLLQRETPIKEPEDIERTVLSTQVGEVATSEEAIAQILYGNSVLVMESPECAFYFQTRLINTRPIEKTEMDMSLRGPKESFNESILDNLGMIRKRIASPDLKIRQFIVGKEANNCVAMLYMKGAAPEDLVRRVQEKLESMKNEFALSVNYVAEALKTDSTSFDTSGSTEKPDTTVSHLFEGRVIVLIDGSPFAMSVPYFFIENFQASDDYYINKNEALFVRLIRVVALLTSILLPGLYVVLTTEHYSLLPTTFIYKLAVSRAGVPLPTVVEMVLMQFFFELSREAGKRLPQPIGQSLSVVAGLILGESAVGVGLSSRATVVVTGVYAICSFINPKLISTILKWSLTVTAASVFFGLQGFYIAFLLFVAQTASLRSCGYPFLFPFGTTRVFNYKAQDILFRGPLKDISTRLLRKKSDEA